MRWIDLQQYQCLGKRRKLSWLTLWRLAGMLQHTICYNHQRDCHHLWTMALIDQKRSFELMNWKRSSMQQLIKTTTLLSGFSRLMRFPTFATTVWRKPTKVHTSYTAEKRFEIHKYHLCHPEASFWRRHCRHFLECLRLRHSTSSSDSHLES